MIGILRHYLETKARYDENTAFPTTTPRRSRLNTWVRGTSSGMTTNRNDNKEVSFCTAE
jgi:hypothetical protein